jgi:nitrite reductase/ring-hydroxylating ferredoxin subunit
MSKPVVYVWSSGSSIWNIVPTAILLVQLSLQQEKPVPTRVELCKADAIAAGSALRVEAAGLTVAVFNIDGQFYVTDDACTHGPGSLSEGFVDGDVIECNFHNGQFNIKTGEIVSPPCMIPIKTYPTIVHDGKVFIEI